MDIKVGDIVDYDGRHYRVLRCSQRSKKKLHLFGDFSSALVYESDVKLVESVEVPILNVGDTVLVNDIPSYEKTTSNGVWVGAMNSKIGKTFTVNKFINHDEYGPLALLGDRWFRTYHLEKINDYDIV